MQKINFILSVTEHCNFNCEYCIEKVQNAKNRFNDFDIEYSVKELEKTIEENKDKKILVSLFGGEPTLKKDKIMKFLNVLKNKKYFKDLEFEITTNAYIFFDELLDFMKKNNSTLRLTISYDSFGQSKRTKDLKVISVVENNVLKYSEYYIKNNIHRCFITNNCCVTEDNVKKVFDSFCDIFFNKKINYITFSTVFTEYWKKESFAILYKQYKLIYEFIINTNKKNNRIIYLLPSISGNHKESWKKYNPLFYQSDDDQKTLKEVHVAENNSNKIFERRFLNKKTYKIKPIIIDKNIQKIEDIELLTLRSSSVNYRYFDKLTMQLLIGDNIKKYKKELYCLFNFDLFLCNKYKKAITKKNKIKINFFSYLNEYKFIDYFIQVLGLEIVQKIHSFFYKDTSILTKDNVVEINDKIFGITNSKERISVRYFNEVFFVNDFFINTNKKNKQKCLLREVARCILNSCLNQLGIKLENPIIDLICNNFYIYIYNTRRKNDI